MQKLIASCAPSEDFRRGPTHVTRDFEQDLSLLLSQLSAIGVPQVVIVDLSRPEFDISVARAVIPGLEAPHDDPDFIPGPRARNLAGAS